MTYSKLHSSLVGSSLWAESDQVRILFVTLLAMCDRDGCIYGSKIGLERLANIVVDLDTPDADPWKTLMSPDPESSDRKRAPENEGRRIEEIPGGFRLLNFEYYRSLRNEDDRREQTRRAVAKHRAMKASVSQDKPPKATDSRGKPIQMQRSDTDISSLNSPPSVQEPLSLQTQLGPTSSVPRARVNGFRKPTLEELRKYLAAKGSPVDPMQFLAFYESNGWKVGKNPMKNWKAAVATWERRRDDL